MSAATPPRRPPTTGPTTGTSWWPSTTRWRWSSTGRRGVPDDGPVDDLRQAFLHHRALFQALLGGAGEDGDRRRGAGRAVVTEAAVVRP